MLAIRHIPHAKLMSEGACCVAIVLAGAIAGLTTSQMAHPVEAAQEAVVSMADNSPGASSSPEASDATRTLCLGAQIDLPF